MNASAMGFEFESLSIIVCIHYFSEHPAANEVHGSMISSFHASLFFLNNFMLHWEKARKV
jgi:hypothetical protein